MKVLRTPWTEAGYRRQEQRIVDLKASIARMVADGAQQRGGANSMGEESIAATVGCTSTTTANALLMDAVMQIDKISIAPAPCQCEHAQLGNGIEVVFVDDDEQAPSGLPGTFILGGDGEVDNDPGLSNIRPPTLSCTSPLGRAVVGRCVGDIIEVKTPKRVYPLEIIAITIPEPTFAQVAQAA